ncbi:hypothetical protein EON64_08400 [archaeon]|nr:MAG: hypothetical protein EON64_08400 [archaeon]
MNESGEPDVDHIIEQLLSVRGARPGRQVNLTENEIKWLCIKSREIFIQQPVLLELEAPIKICGMLFFCIAPIRSWICVLRCVALL